MKRIPEPELMDDAEQAAAYANADFEEPHNHFLSLFKDSLMSKIPESGQALDLGCGAADISIRFAKAFPEYQIDAIDGSKAMLAEASKAIENAGLCKRIHLIQAYLQDSILTQNYAVIFSNALLHHLHDPSVLWRLIKTASGNPAVFVMDLMRPETEMQVNEMVETYAGSEPLILKRDFGNSLKAGFTPEEVESQLKTAGLNDFQVTVVSDRHYTVSS